MFGINFSENRVVLMGHRKVTPIWSIFDQKSHGKGFAQKAPIIIYTQYKHFWDKFEQKQSSFDGHRRVTPIWSLLVRKSHGKLFGRKTLIIIYILIRYTQYKHVLHKFQRK